ncbi:MAG: nucleoside deaminase [Patescibacteria group bacterium]
MTPLWRIHPKQQYIEIAIQEALKNFRSAGEHPIGAVLVSGRDIVAQSGNRCHIDNNPMAHAEAVVMEMGCRQLNRRYLQDCALYTTHQPCPMCAWSMITAKLDMLIWGTNSEDVKKIVKPPERFRTQEYEPDHIFNGVDGADHGIHYFPGRYAQECVHLLQLCSDQQPLPFPNTQKRKH